METSGASGGHEAAMRRLISVNVLYTFIVSALSVAVPLYLVQKRIDVGSIGLILAVGPLTFMVLRIVFACIADEEGTGRVVGVYAAMTALAIAVYMVSGSPLLFAIGVLLEGVRSSAFWAVVRTEVIARKGGGDAREILTRFSNYRQLADGLARLAIGFVIAALSFIGAFGFLLALSLAMAAIVLPKVRWEDGHRPLNRSELARVFKSRPRTFWYSAFLQMLIWLAYNMMTQFLLPVYLTAALGFQYEQTGLMMALLSLATAVTSIALMRLDISKRTLIALSLAAVPALALFPLAGSDVLPLLVLLAFGTGCSNIVAEYILVDQVYRSRDVSTEIGVLYVPLRIGEFLFLSLGGLVISAYGYEAPFAFLAASVALFVAFGRSVIR